MRARVLLTYGNASQKGSPHAGDQLKLFSKQELRPVWRTRKEIEANLEAREALQVTKDFESIITPAKPHNTTRPVPNTQIVNFHQKF